MVADAVDEERRGARHVAEVGAVDVARHARSTDVVFDVVGKARNVEVELAGVADQISHRQCILMLKEQVVHLPEGALGVGRFGGLSSELCVRVHVGQREMTPHVTDVAKLRQQFAHDRFGLPAVRAFEVAILKQRHQRLMWATNMVALDVDWVGEIDDCLRPTQ